MGVLVQGIPRRLFAGLVCTSCIRASFFWFLLLDGVALSFHSVSFREPACLFTRSFYPSILSNYRSTFYYSVHTPHLHSFIHLLCMSRHFILCSDSDSESESDFEWDPPFFRSFVFLYPSSSIPLFYLFFLPFMFLLIRSVRSVLSIQFIPSISSIQHDPAARFGWCLLFICLFVPLSFSPSFSFSTMPVPVPVLNANTNVNCIWAPIAVG